MQYPRVDLVVVTQRVSGCEVRHNQHLDHDNASGVGMSKHKEGDHNRALHMHVLTYAHARTQSQTQSPPHSIQVYGSLQLSIYTWIIVDDTHTNKQK